MHIVKGFLLTFTRALICFELEMWISNFSMLSTDLSLMLIENGQDLNVNNINTRGGLLNEREFPPPSSHAIQHQIPFSIVHVVVMIDFS